VPSIGNYEGGQKSPDCDSCAIAHAAKIDRVPKAYPEKTPSKDIDR